MTLKPTAVTPLSMKSLGSKKQPAFQKKMVIDCKHESHWQAVHAPNVNGVVLRRRPIRAIETYLDSLLSANFEAVEFKASQNQLRKELEKHLILKDEDQEIRRKFLINDITAQTRVMIGQSQSRDFLFHLCPKLPADFHGDAGALKMIVTYRGLEVEFRQPNDKDIRPFSPYGVALFRGQNYSRQDASPVEWRIKEQAEKGFWLTIEPFSRFRK